MPIYEYRCDECGHQFDAIQKFSDDPLVTCPSCNADALKKLLSAPAFQLKGTGWYETDFKTKKAGGGSDSSSSDSSSSSSSSSSGSSGSGSSSSDSKPAAKSETKSSSASD